MKTRTR